MKNDFGLTKPILDQIIKTLSMFPEVKKVVIFGSRAKGNYKSHSDIDIAIYAPEMSSTEFSLLWNKLDDLSIIFKMDIVHFDRITNTELKNKIIAEGIAFYPST